MFDLSNIIFKWKWWFFFLFISTQITLPNSELSKPSQESLMNDFLMIDIMQKDIISILMRKIKALAVEEWVIDASYRNITVFEMIINSSYSQKKNHKSHKNNLLLERMHQIWKSIYFWLNWNSLTIYHTVNLYAKKYSMHWKQLRTKFAAQSFEVWKILSIWPDTMTSLRNWCELKIRLLAGILEFHLIWFVFRCILH